jgi:hypothetical protein
MSNSSLQLGNINKTLLIIQQYSFIPATFKHFRIEYSTSIMNSVLNSNYKESEVQHLLDLVGSVPSLTVQL